MRRHHSLVLTLIVLCLTVVPAVALAWSGDARGSHATAVLAAAPAQGRDALSSACTVVITETVGFDPLRVCDQQPVTVTLGLSCPTQLPLHVVFVVGNHLAMEDDLDDVKQAARETLNAMPWIPGTMAGLVTLSTQARREVDLTASRGTVQSAIGRIQLDPINPFIDYYDWLGTARQMLEEARQGAVSPLEVIVVYSTGCPTGFEDYCTRQNAAASKAKGAGIWVSGICNPNARPFGFPLPSGHCRTLQQMSSQGFYHDLRQASRVAQDLDELAVAATKLNLDTVTLTEMLAPGISLVAGSAAPVPRIRGQELAFSWRDVQPGTLVTTSYHVVAAAPGPAPLRTTDSNVTLLDSLDRGIEPVPVPTRTLNVVSCDAPTPTATHTPLPTATDTPPASPTPPLPTDTPTPLPTPTPSPSPMPKPARLVLPVLFRAVCKGGRLPADIVLALDASRSMDEAAGGTIKLAAAKDAARQFVRLLDPAWDQAAVVSFHTDTSLVPLTADLPALEAAIDAIHTQPGTRIDRALGAVLAELYSSRARPGSTRVLVLLTDGRTEEGTAPDALAVAREAKSAGAQLYAIGLGDQVDEGFLRQLASGPDSYLHAPEPSQLATLYQRIAAELPCPGGAMLPVP